MIEIVLHRSLSRNLACSDVRECGLGDISHGRQGKSADVRRADVVGRAGGFEAPQQWPLLALSPKLSSEIKAASAIASLHIGGFAP